MSPHRCIILVLVLLVAGVISARADRFDDARAKEALLAELTGEYQRGEYEHIIEVLGDSLPPAESTPRLFNLLGLALAAEARHQDAVAAYESGMRMGGSRLFELHINLGLSLQTLGMGGRAMAEFQRAVELAPGELEAQLALGEGYLDYRRFEQARAPLEQAVQLAPEDPRVLRQLARLADETGDDDQSLRWWVRLEGLAPDPDTARRLGELHAGQEGRAAIGWYQLCVERDPAATDCAAAAGGLLMAEGEAGEALDWLRRAEAGGDDSPELIHNLLLACHQTGTIDSLEALLARRTPARGDSWGVVALARRQAERPLEALDAAERAHELDPQNPDLANILAVLLHENGRTPEARAIWRRILESHPDHPQAQSNLAEAR